MMDPNHAATNGAMGTSAVQTLPNGVQTLALPNSTTGNVVTVRFDFAYKIN